MKKRKTNIEMERKMLKRIAVEEKWDRCEGSCQKNGGKLVIPAKDEVEGKDRGVLWWAIMNVIMFFTTQ